MEFRPYTLEDLIAKFATIRIPEKDWVVFLSQLEEEDQHILFVKQ